MSSVYVVGVDPGAITGVCILSREGVIDAWQDDKDISHQRLIQWVRANRDNTRRVAVEEQFMAKPRAPTPGDSSWGTSPHAVIEVSKSAGETIGWLKCSGYPPSQIVDVLPQTWRSKVGVKGKGRVEKEAMARLYASKVFGAMPVGHTHKAEAYCIAQWCWNEIAFNLESPISRIMPR